MRGYVYPLGHEERFSVKVLYIGLFGVLGVYARYGAQLLAGKYFASVFPLGTFAVNIVGSFLAGLVFAFAARSAISEELKFGLLVGFLGGFTTFSAYCLEVTLFLKEGRYTYAAVYLTLSVLLGVASVFAGLSLARTL